MWMSALLRQSGLGGARGGTAGDRDAGYRAWCCAGPSWWRMMRRGTPSPHHHLTRTPRLKKLNPIISLFVPHPAVARLPQQITLGCGWLDRLAQCLAQCLALIDEVNDLRVPGFCPPAATFHFNPSPVLVSECSAANRLIGEVVQSRRRSLLGPSPGWKRLLPLSHLRHYANQTARPFRLLCRGPNFTLRDRGVNARLA